MHPKGDSEFFMKEGRQKPIDVRVRVSNELHEELKAHARKEERSMNYLINKAVEFYLNQKESAKA
jgi:predicted HicB family RNase H-like nuclease